MGKFNESDLGGVRIENTSEFWDKKTGKLVEDFITRSLEKATIKELQYTPDNILTIVNLDGSTNSIEISVIQPEIRYGLKVFGLEYDGRVHQTDVTTLFNSSKTIKLGIAIYSISVTTVATDRIGPFDVTIQYGGRSLNASVLNFKYNDYLNEDGNFDWSNIDAKAVQWIDITELFKESVPASLIKITAKDDETAVDQTTFNVTNEVLVLSPASTIVVSDNITTFVLSGNSLPTSDYKITGWCNGVEITGATGLSYSGMTPGLNQFLVRAELKTNSKIVSDYITADIICTTNGYEETTVAINKVSDNIINNGIAALYEATIYNPKLEDVQLNTYLEESTIKTGETPENLIKTIILTASDFLESNTKNTTQYKYIEINSSSAKRYLYISNKDLYYKFWSVDLQGNSRNQTYKTMYIDAVDTNLIYYQDVLPLYNFDLSTGYINDVFITDTYAEEIGKPANIISDLEVSDGWVEELGRLYFKASAQNKELFKSPLPLNLGDQFTIEFGFKTYNISDESKPIFSFGGFQLRPTEFCWNYTDENNFKKRNSPFLEEVDTHIVITFDKQYSLKDKRYYPDYLLGNEQENFDNFNMTIPLVRVFVNGVIDREMALDATDYQDLSQWALSFNPQSSDINVYSLRVYNNKALEWEDVLRNYTSFLPNKDKKVNFYEANNILFTTGERKGEIQFSKCLGKYNTLVYVFPKETRFPNYSWNTTSIALDKDENALYPSTLFINYADSAKNTNHGGRLTNGRIKAQGSSAKRYLIHNVQFDLNKYDDYPSTFTPYSALLENNTFKPNSSTEDCYYMPSYKDQYTDPATMKVSKLVGKVNFASSMQTHKPGACNLYEEAFKNSYKKQLPTGGRKTVHEEPFLYFYLETNLDDVSGIELADLLKNDAKVEFMGFQTWGSGKGDKETFGYDKNKTPGYILMEGGENADVSVQFRCPWHELQRWTKEEMSEKTDLTKENIPACTESISKQYPWKHLFIEGESISFNGDDGSWDINFGANKTENGFTDNDDVHNSVKAFREFYDFVYIHDYNFVVVGKNELDTNTWDQGKKYLVDTDSFSNNPDHVKAGDVYRYSEALKKWVPAGLFYNAINKKWDTLNYYDYTGQGDIDNVRLWLKQDFTLKIPNYVEIDDITFHQAFIKYVSGTDNRAKNTYYLIIGDIYEEGVKTDKGDFKIRMMLDDLDTIFVTDNNGLQSKPYDLLETSYDESFANYWGDKGRNIFFTMIDQCFELKIKLQLKQIITFAGINSDNVGNTGNFMYDNFFAIQEKHFPAVAYNHTSKIYYENNHFILNSGVFGNKYTNNDVKEPLIQSHGNALTSEKQFLKKRLDFLSTYVVDISKDHNISFTTLDTGEAAYDINILMDMTPYRSFYPIRYYNGSDYILASNPDSEYDALRYLAVKDSLYKSIKIPSLVTPSVNHGFGFTHLYKTLTITGLKRPYLDGNFDHLTELVIDNDLLGTDNMFRDYPEFKLSGFTGSKFKVLETLKLRNMELPDGINLTPCTKLKTLDLEGGSNIKEIVFPQSGRLENIILPESLLVFRIYNNPGLENILFTSLNNLKTVYIDCAKCGKFDVNAFCENLINCGGLKSVTFKNADLWITEDALYKLITTDFSIEGSIHIVTVAGGKTLKSISYATKETLVKEFGNIDSEDSKVKVYYHSDNITAFTVNPEISLYMPTGYSTYVHPATVFGIAVANGNDVEITGDPAKLNITYTMSTIRGVASIDSEGRITQESESDSVATVTIKMKVANRPNPLEQKVTVRFKWVAPEIGNFAYADGTFSGGFDPSKTLVGLVYAKEALSDTEGDVYILGKEYSSETALYLGYEAEEGNVNSSESTLVEAGYIKNYVNNTLKLSSNYASPEGVSSGTDHDVNVDITVEGYEDISNLTFTGKADTLAYVQNVNTVLLPKLISNNSYSKYITTDQSGNVDSYYISSLTNLINLGNTIKVSNVSSNLASCLLFPYFYSMYLYEPTVKEGETLDEQYKQGKWYAPSVSELNRVLYYRGYSAMGNSFLASNSVRSNIDRSLKVVSSKGILGIPLFSIALSKMPSDFPTEWTTFNGNSEKDTNGGINNIATTMDSANTDNYSYVSYQGWINNEYTITTGWRAGAYLSGYITPEGYNASRLIPHQGIPFVTYHYKKVN